MAVDFDAWIVRPDVDRVLLVEAKAYFDSAESTLYLSTLSKKTFGYYYNVIQETPIISRSMPEAFGGVSLPGFGSIDFANDGTFDDWIYYSWSGRDIQFFLGDPSWDRADFEQVFTGKVDNLEISGENTLRLNIRGKDNDLDRPVSDWKYSSGEADGKYKPLCWGTCFNVTPVLITSGSNPVYQVNNGLVEDVCVDGTLKVNGVVSAISVTKNNSAGTFELASDPNGTVTCDAQGHKVGSTFYQMPGEIIKEILETWMGFSTSDFDTDTITDFDSVGHTVGIYNDGRLNGLDVLALLVSTYMGYSFFTRNGLLKLGILEEPELGTSVLDFDNNETLDAIGISIEPVPRFRTTIGYERNWTVQTEIATDTTKVTFQSTDYRETQYTDPDEADIKDEWVDALDADMEKTPIDNSTDALVEAQARQEMFNKQRYRIVFTSASSGFLLEIGDIASITDDRYGLNNQKFLVTSIDDDFVNNMVTIGGWF